jgi:membrane fusion protein (multidrug efflux system)
MAQTKKPGNSFIGKVARKVAAGVALAIVVAVLLLALSGKFHRKIGAATTPTTAATEPRSAALAADVALVPVTVLRTPVIEPAVGTIQAVHEADVASKLLAKVTEVDVQAGQEVKAGEVLVRLDDRDLQAQLRQAEAVVAAAQAARDHAQTEYERVKRLYEQSDASKTEFDQADTTRKSTSAELERAVQARAQAQTVLEYATVRSPIDGRVIDKRVEVGDTASPGQVLVTLYDPTHMQLVAHVREALTHRLKVGQTVGVQVDALGHACEGRVSEIVPEAQSTSRTFTVKVTGPCPPGVYSGMFGRLLIPLDEEEVLVIPKTAVKRVGQLDTVEVAENTAGAGVPAHSPAVLERRVIELGRQFGDQVQVLSGLRVGERVATSSPS